jgi:hypothetical protein
MKFQDVIEETKIFPSVTLSEHFGGWKWENQEKEFWGYMYKYGKVWTASDNRGNTFTGSKAKAANWCLSVAVDGPTWEN